MNRRQIRDDNFAEHTVLFRHRGLFYRDCDAVCGRDVQKARLKSVSWIASIAGFVILTGYLVARGIEAGHIPFSNQFEFATAFGWGSG